jgi:peptide deformylase
MEQFMSRDVLILGNPTLRKVSTVIRNFNNPEFKEEIQDLKEALETFRKEHGFGRGIAAIQIGIPKRMIALNLSKDTYVIINPEITQYSTDTFTMWDDCMSFPDLVVRVKRNRSICIEYQNEQGVNRVWDTQGIAEAELLQHEIDHLDGILAIDRAIEKTDIIYKSEYNKEKEYYNSQVDYHIVQKIK